MDAPTTHPAPGRTHRSAPVAAALLAALVALLLLAAPAVAVEDAPAPATTEEGGRPAVADTPRDQLGLLLYGALAAMAVGGLLTVNRQLKGRRPQATGEFRWR